MKSEANIRYRAAALYSKHRSAIHVGLILSILALYFLEVWHGAGRDLEQRILASRYFLAGINPYDVHMGRVAEVDGLGLPPAYSFFSYYLIAPLTSVASLYWEKMIYAAVDLAALAGGIWLTNRLLKIRNHAGPLVLATLVCSVHFRHHVDTLNYNLIAAFGACLAFYGIEEGNAWWILPAVVLAGVKPTIAIPLFIYLLVTARWLPLLLAVALYLAVLYATSWWFHASPSDLLMQLHYTQSYFSGVQGGYTDGFFFFARPLVNDGMTVLGVAISFLVMTLYRRQLADPVNGLVAVVALGVGLFFNQTNAWIIAYPLLIIALDQSRSRRPAAVPIACLLAFLLVPRLVGLVPVSYRDSYVIVHNVLRFGLLFMAAGVLVRNRSGATTESLAFA